MTRQRATPMLIAAALGAIAITVTGCTATTGTNPAPPAAAIDHIHGLGTDPKSGMVYIAAHDGVFAVQSATAAPVSGTQLGKPVGGHVQDVMALTVSGGTIYASGHPTQSNLAVVGGPNLGLIKSTDGAATWQTVSLGGKVDFHELAVAPNDPATLYGYAESVVAVSHDRGVSWTAAAPLAVRDLTVDTGGLLYATTDKGLMRSTDQGATFEAVPGAPSLYLVEAMADSAGLIGIASDNTVWRFGNGAWVQTGTVAGQVHAMSYREGTVPALLIADDRGVHLSDSFGQAWRSLVVL